MTFKIKIYPTKINLEDKTIKKKKEFIIQCNNYDEAVQFAISKLDIFENYLITQIK